MTQGRLATVLRNLHQLGGAATVRELTDGQLLERFTTAREEASFAALVRRHGPLVLGVCRRVLHHEQDAEDAFQATFLVLAHKAGSIRKGEALGNWLYGVARRIALKARARAARRQAPIRAAVLREPQGPASELALRELQAILDEEVSRLPEKYRAPFVLCCLEGKSKPEAAQELGWKEAQSPGDWRRLAGGFELRLTRRGVTLSAALCAAALGQTSAVAVPTVLSTTTVRAVLAVTAGELPAAGVVSAQVAVMTRAALQGTLAAWLKVLVPCVLVLAAAVGTGLHFSLTPPTDPPARSAGGPDPQQARQPLADRPSPIRPRNRRPRAAAGLRVLAVSRDGRLLACAGWNENLLRLCDATTGKELRQFRGHTTPVHAVAFSPDATRLASADDRDLRLWQTATGREIYRQAGESVGSITVLVFTHDGKGLAAGNRETRICLWDVATGKLTWQAQGHTAAVAALAFSREGKFLASGDGNGKLGLWSAPNGKQMWLVAGHPGGVLCVALSPDSKLLASGGRDQTVRLWDVATRQEIWRVKQSGDVRAVAFAPDGKILASGAEVGPVMLWEVRTGKSIRQLARPQGQVSWVAFTEDGKQLVTGGDVARLLFWDAATGKGMALVAAAPSKRETGPVVCNPGEVNMLTFRQVMAVAAAAGLALGQVGSLQAQAKPAAASITSTSRDGKVMASSDGKVIRFFDVRTGKELRRLAGHQGQVTALAFSPNGKLFASGSVDRTVRLWEVATGRIRAQMLGHKAAISAVTFSADGKTLTTQGTDQKAMTWDAATGKLIK